MLNKRVSQKLITQISKGNMYLKKKSMYIMLVITNQYIHTLLLTLITLYVKSHLDIVMRLDFLLFLTIAFLSGHSSITLPFMSISVIVILMHFRAIQVNL